MQGSTLGLLTDFTHASELDTQIDAVLFRLQALQNGKKLFYKLDEESTVWNEWIPSFTNMLCILEGHDTSPPVISMACEWRIEG